MYSINNKYSATDIPIKYINTVRQVTGLIYPLCKPGTCFPQGLNMHSCLSSTTPTVQHYIVQLHRNTRTHTHTHIWKWQTGTLTVNSHTGHKFRGEGFFLFFFCQPLRNEDGRRGVREGERRRRRRRTDMQHWWGAAAAERHTCPSQQPVYSLTWDLKGNIASESNKAKRKKKWTENKNMFSVKYNLCPLVVLLMPPVVFVRFSLFWVTIPDWRGLVKVWWWGNLSGIIAPCSHTRPLNPLCWLWANRSMPLSFWIGKCGRGPKYRPVPRQWWGCPSCRNNLSGRRTELKKKEKRNSIQLQRQR